MTKQVLVVHGAGVRLDHRSGGWETNLQDALGADYDVVIPQMPDPENPRYLAWRNQLVATLATLGRSVILVGHSIGGSVLLKFLSEDTCKKTISGLFIVSAPCWGADGDWQSEDFALPEDLAKLLQIPRIYLYHGRADQVVSFSHLAYYGNKLPHATVRVLDGRGHDFTKGDLPEIIDDIRNLN